MKYSFHSVDTCNMCGSDGRKIMGRRLNTAQGLRPKKRIGISTTVVKCSDCGLIYADPLPVPENIEDHYGLPPESYWKGQSFEVLPDHFRNEFRRIQELAPQAKTFLDIGSGTGKTLVAALNNGFDAYGLEASTPFYEKALEKLTDKRRLKHVSFEDAEYPEQSFDVISFGVVLEHLYNPSAALEKALKWLKPNGIIHVEVPDANYIFSKVFNAYFWLTRTDFVVNISPMHPPFHLYEFTEKSFRANGERLGYSVAHLDRYPGLPPLNALNPVMPVLGPLMNLTHTGVGLILYLRRHSLR
jgi:SAM-dependent methyltransferase